MIINDIFAMQKKYEKKYGSKVVILSQIGGFFEIYGCENKDEKVGNVSAIAELLNVVKTKKDKKNPANDENNPELCGFPLSSLVRNLGVLVSAGYTTVVMEQVQGPPAVKREITRIVSPGTYIDEGSHTYQSNHLMCFVIKKEKQARGGYVNRLGCSSYDLSTGHSTAYEALDVELDKSFALSEGVRMIKSFNPREIILYGDLTNELQSQLEIGDRTVHMIDTIKGCEKVSFMNQFLEEFYKDRGHLSPIEHIDLEHKQLACIAFVNLLRFVYDHNESALKDLQKPKILNELQSLCLENNAIQQLNVLPTGTITTKATPNSIHSLMDVVGYCKTPMGHRRLRDRLCRPLCIGSEIKQRHDQVEAMLLNDLQEDVQKKLKGVGDLERLIRKLCTQKTDRGIASNDILKIWSGAESARDCIEMLCDVGQANDAIGRLVGNDQTTLMEIQEMLDTLAKTFDKSALEVNTSDGCFFARGYDAELDKLFDAVKNGKAALQAYRKTFNDALDANNDTMVKLEFTDKDGWALVTTKKRAEDLKRRLPLVVERELIVEGLGSGAQPMQSVTEEVIASSLTVVCSLSAAKISTGEFRQAAEDYTGCLDHARAKSNQLFAVFCEQFQSVYANVLKTICELIIQIDLCACAAETAIKRRHCKPQVDLDNEAGASYLKAVDLRHPVIEALQMGVEYVPSSVFIGAEGTLNEVGFEMSMNVFSGLDGMLLYGCNSAGKSSLMKSIGLSIILAQAGFYVPSSTFKFRPFTSIMTRILSNDDIFKGQSSFSVEMAELSSIMKRSDHKTLVLGDEIANSTESTSGMAIVAAAIQRLASAKTKFVFATHLHELAKMEFIKTLDNVKHFHLEIRYDARLDSLVYDRKLREGSGTAVYGLEIARAMGMDDEFLETAHNLRRQLLQTEKDVVSEKSSRYNANVFMKPCQVCASPGSDVHHIKEQATADQRGFVGNIHKNDSSNLVVLCKTCHDKVHQSKTLEIKGYIQTDKGRKLQFTETPDKISLPLEKYKYKLRPRGKVTKSLTDVSIPQQIIC